MSLYFMQQSITILLCMSFLHDLIWFLQSPGILSSLGPKHKSPKSKKEKAEAVAVQEPKQDKKVKSQSSPSTPSHTKEYNYEASDNQSTPKKPKGFSYEKQNLGKDKGDTDNHQSPPGKRATGLAFNYAPGEEDKLKKQALKDKNKNVSPFKDPKSDSAAFLASERYTHSPADYKTPVKTSTEFVPVINGENQKTRSVKLYILTAKKDPKSGKLDMDSADIDSIIGTQNTATGLIDSKCGMFDFSNGSVIITDPSNNQKEVVQGLVDPITKQIVIQSGSVINPKTGKRDSSSGQIVAFAEIPTQPNNPGAIIPKKKLIKLKVVIGKKDSKTGQIDRDKAVTENVIGILNPVTGEIDTKYGLINLTKRQITIKDTKSEKTDVRPVEFDPDLNQITIKNGVVDPKSGKVDHNLGQLITILDDSLAVVPITSVTAQRDPKSGQLDPTKAHKETTNGQFDSQAVELLTKYGVIDINSRNIKSVDSKTKQKIQRPIQLDNAGNIIILSGVVDPVSGERNENMSQILQVSPEIDSAIKITSTVGKLDKKGIDHKSATTEQSEGYFDPVTNRVYTKYGIYSIKNGTLTSIDPKHGKSEIKHGVYDPNSDDAVLFKGIYNQKLGKVDPGYGRTIKIEINKPLVESAHKPVVQELLPKEKVDTVVPSSIPPIKTRIIKLLIITGRKDPKTGHIDVENGTVDNSVGVIHSTGEIDSKIGLINSKTGTVIVSDPETGKKEVLKGNINPETGQIEITSGPVLNPKTGKLDNHLGQLVTIVEDSSADITKPVLNALPSHPIPKKRIIKLLVITAKKDPQTGLPDTQTGTVEKILGTLDPVNEIVDTKYGKIDLQNTKILQKDQKSGKVLISPIKIDESSGQIYVDKDITDLKTGKIDPSLSRVINIIDRRSPIVTVTCVKGRRDVRTGKVDPESERSETNSGLIDITTGNIASKYGLINLNKKTIVVKDPNTGELIERPIEIDGDDNLIISSCVTDPKTGKVDPNMIQIITIGSEIDPELQVTTYVGKFDVKKNTIDAKNATTETTAALFDPNRNIIHTKYGQIDPVGETLTVTDPKTGKIDVRHSLLNPNGEELLFKGGFINNKTGKIDPSFARAVSLHITEPSVDSNVQDNTYLNQSKQKADDKPKPTLSQDIPKVSVRDPTISSQKTPQSIDLQKPVPKQRIVKVLVITVKKDPKTGQAVADGGVVEHLTGIVDANGFIEMKYGLIDPKTGSIISHDTKTGQKNVVQGKVDATTGQIVVPGSKLVDPSMSKQEPILGQIFSIVGFNQDSSTPIPKKRMIKITVITIKIDPKTGKPDSEKAHVEHSLAALNPITGLIESKYGLIDPRSGKVILNDLKTGNVDVKPVDVDESTGQITLKSGVDPKTGKLTTDLNQIISIAGQTDPVVDITTITAMKDTRTGMLDVNKGQMEMTKGKRNLASGEVTTKYGVINLKALTITSKDPRTGKMNTRPIQRDTEGNIIILSGVVDPKTDTVNSDLGQLIKIGSEIEPEAVIVTVSGKIDPKKNVIESKGALLDVSYGLYNPMTHKIYSKYGQIDPTFGTLTYVDPNTGRQDVKQGTIDPNTGQILIKGLTNPKTGKPDPTYGKTITVFISEPKINDKGQIEKKGEGNFKIDPKTGQIWTFDYQDTVAKQDVYNTSYIDPVTGYIITVYGYLDPKSGSFNKIQKLDPATTKYDPETNQIYTKTNETDEMGTPIYSISEIDLKTGDVYTKYGKIDPKTGKLVIIRIYLLTQADETGKVKEIDPKDCQIDEKTGKIINVTTQTVYMYSMVDPKTGKVIQVDPNDPLVRSANTKVTQILTLSGEIDPITGKIHTEWGHIDPQTGDIDPKTARRDPITGELVLNYAQIDPSHFSDLKDTRVKVKTYTKSDENSSSDGETSDDDLDQYASENMNDLTGFKIPTLKSTTTPVIVKTTTKQIMTKDRDGVTQNIEEKVEDGRTGEVTISTQLNKVGYIHRP